MKGNTHHCSSLQCITGSRDTVSPGPRARGWTTRARSCFVGPRAYGDRHGHLAALTNDMHAAAEILPALELFRTQVKVAQAEATALLDAPSADVILLDARRDLVGARSLCRLIETTGKESPLLVIASEGGLAALSADWGFDDLLLSDGRTCRGRRPDSAWR